MSGKAQFYPDREQMRCSAALKRKTNHEKTTKGDRDMVTREYIEASQEIKGIMKRLREFGEKYEYNFVSVSFNNGNVYAWTPDGGPNRLDIYERR